MFGQDRAVIIIDLVTMTMTLFDLFTFVQCICFRMFIQYTGTGTKPQSSADILHSVLIRHQGDDRIRRIGIQFHTVCIFQICHMTRIFHNGELHAKA